MGISKNWFWIIVLRHEDGRKLTFDAKDVKLSIYNQRSYDKNQVEKINFVAASLNQEG